jgi:DtxR family Mn-dependent transcriptional regulator
VTEALADFLGHPTTCPRGNPIPDENGLFTPLQASPLREVEIGKTVKVCAVNATATDVLTYLQERSILPGQEIEVVDIAPLQGPLTLRIRGKECAIGLQMADFVLVDPIQAHGKEEQS